MSVTDAVTVKRRDELKARNDEWPKMRSRWIVPPSGSGWSGFVLSEWELEGATWTDRHHHDELNFILEGKLEVESGGVTVVARPGDTVTVKAGNLGRYTAPDFARMIAVYGPNPGKPDEDVGYFDCT